MLRRNIAVVFPGQGSQYVGMAKKLYESHEKAREIIDVASTEVSAERSLKSIMFEGDEKALTMTNIAQPAILAASLAAYYSLVSNQLDAHVSNGQSVTFLGHSLGEYCALVASGSLSFVDAVRLVHIRGHLMQEAADQFVSLSKLKVGMVALLLKESLLHKEGLSVLQDGIASYQRRHPHEIVDIANYNASDTLVLSGALEHINRCIKSLRVAEANSVPFRAIPLKVSAPFHGRLMQSLLTTYHDEITRVRFNIANCPRVISNVTAEPFPASNTELCRLLVQQISSPVQWYPSLLYCRQTLNIANWSAFGPSSTMYKIITKEFPKDACDFHGV